jgi:hypothetical protein
MDLVADACIPRKCVDALRAMGYGVLYINETWNPSMPDNEVKQIGYALHVPIATCNQKHFLDYDDLIPIRPRKWSRQVNDVLKYLEGRECTGTQLRQISREYGRQNRQS